MAKRSPTEPTEEPIEAGEMIVREFEIYVEVLPQLRAKLDKFIAKAKRLGLDPIVYEVGEVEDRVYTPEDRDLPAMPYQVRKVFIVGTPPKVKGYTFVGKLEHTAEGNLVAHMNKDIPLLAKYRTTAPVCEHCGLTRKRSQSYVLRGDDGRYFQVGKSCLVDFLGRGDPGELAEGASLVQLAIDAGEAYARRQGPPPRGEETYLLGDFLAVVFEDIDKRGWKGNRDIDERKKELTTLDAAWEKMRVWRLAPEGKAAAFRPAPKFYAQAAEAAAWAASVPLASEDDFHRNLGIIARTGTVSRGQAARAVWIAHAREAGKEREARRLAREVQEAKAAEALPVGKPGEKLGVLLHVDKNVDLGPSEYHGGGTRYLILMHDDQGNRFVWRTTGLHYYEDPITGRGRRFDPSTSHAVACVVKSHDQYKGGTQTALERCKAGTPGRKATGPLRVPEPLSADTAAVLAAALKGRLVLGGIQYMPESEMDRDEPQILSDAAVHELVDRQVLQAGSAESPIEQARHPLELSKHGWSEMVSLGLTSRVPTPAKTIKGKKPKQPPATTADDTVARMASELYQATDNEWSHGTITRHGGPWTTAGTEWVQAGGRAVPTWTVPDGVVTKMLEDGLLDWHTSGTVAMINEKGLLRAYDLGVKPALTGAEVDALQDFGMRSPVIGPWQTFSSGDVRRIGDATVPLRLIRLRLFDAGDKSYMRETRTTLSQLGRQVLADHVRPNPAQPEGGDVKIDMLVREYEVSEQYIGVLKHKLDALVKKAAKLSLGTLVYEVGPLEKKIVRPTLDLGHGREFEVFFHRVLVVGEYPVIGGWRVVAKLLHTDEGNVIFSFDPEVKIPDRFRKAKNVCEHCGLARKRIETFVLRSESGQFKQVGSDCLADFVGYADPAAMFDPYQVLMLALLAAQAAQEESEEGYGEGKGGSTVSLDAFLGWVAMAADNVGWRGRKSADGTMGVPTVDAAIELMLTFRKASKEGGRAPKPDAKQVAKAKAALEWANAIPESEPDEFLRNLSVIAKLGYVGPDTMGLGAWIVRGYEKSLELASKAEHSGWLGKVGDSIVAKLTLLRSPSTSGMYGLSYGHVFNDDAGNEAIWWTSTNVIKGKPDVQLTPGTVVTLACTIKENVERKGVKQTILTRCKLAPADAAPGKAAPKKKQAITQEMADVLAHVSLYGTLKAGDRNWFAAGLGSGFWSTTSAAVTALRSLELLTPTKTIERGKPDLMLTPAGVEAAKAAVAAHVETMRLLDEMSDAERAALKQLPDRTMVALQLQSEGKAAGTWSHGSYLPGIPDAVAQPLIGKGMAEIAAPGKTGRTSAGGLVVTKEGSRIKKAALEHRAIQIVAEAMPLVTERPDVIRTLASLRWSGTITWHPNDQQAVLDTMAEDGSKVRVMIPAEHVQLLLDKQLVYGTYDNRYSKSSYGSQLLLTTGQDIQTRWD